MSSTYWVAFYCLRKAAVVCLPDGKTSWKVKQLINAAVLLHDETCLASGESWHGGRGTLGNT